MIVSEYIVNPRSLYNKIRLTDARALSIMSRQNKFVLTNQLKLLSILFSIKLNNFLKVVLSQIVLLNTWRCKRGVSRE